MLTTTQIESVRSSFSELEKFGIELARRFYTNLFQLKPEFRGLFHGDLQSQGQKLIDMLGFVVDTLDAPEKLLPAVRELGVRHSQYRVEPDHYQYVRRALLKAMEDLLGERFDDECRVAWGDAYDLLAATMIEAATAKKNDAVV